jgi:predicted ester cyclase
MLFAKIQVPFHAKESEIMSAMRETAETFFDACDTGKGWEGCQKYCHPNATFSAQSDALAGIDTLEGYTNWMKGLLGILPNGSYEIKFFAVDDDRDNVCAYAVFRGTHSGEGGPVPPTHKTVEADYVYVMEFDGERISHVTKIWNDPYSMKQLGWV